jgi:hypothetical protein
LQPPKGEKLTFGQLLKPENITEDTFAEISEFKSWFHDESIELDNPEHWFEVDVLGIEPAKEPTGEYIKDDQEVIDKIRWLTLTDSPLTKLRATLAQPAAGHLVETDGVIYNRGRIKVPHDNGIKLVILRGRHNSKLEGHPGRAKTLTLVQRCFTWPSQKQYVNHYVNG